MLATSLTAAVLGVGQRGSRSFRVPGPRRLTPSASGRQRRAARAGPEPGKLPGWLAVVGARRYYGHTRSGAEHLCALRAWAHRPRIHDAKEAEKRFAACGLGLSRPPARNVLKRRQEARSSGCLLRNCSSSSQVASPANSSSSSSTSSSGKSSSISSGQNSSARSGNREACSPLAGAVIGAVVGLCLALAIPRRRTERVRPAAPGNGAGGRWIRARFRVNTAAPSRPRPSGDPAASTTTKR